MQRQLVDINQRYDILGERLADRQAELQSTLEKVKAYLQDLQDILRWLEDKEMNTMPFGESLPTEEDGAQDKLKEYRTFHDELVSKEPVVATLRTKAHQLIQNKEHVPGMKDVKKQLKQLGM